MWTFEKWSLFVDLQGFGGTARSLGIKTGRENDWTRRQLLQPTCWLDLPVWRSESTRTSLTTGTTHSSKAFLFSPIPQQALRVLSQRTLWWSYWEIALYNPVLVNIVQQPIVDTWNGFLICLDFLFPQSSKGTDSEFRWCIFLFCILSWNRRYFPSKMSNWWSCCKGSGLTVFPSAAELQWRSLKSHS